MSHTITITGKKNKVLSKIKMPKNIRVAQISWSPLGDVDEVSFQFGDIDTDIHEIDSETERAPVGFVRNETDDYDDRDEEDE